MMRIIEKNRCKVAVANNLERVNSVQDMLDIMATAL